MTRSEDQEAARAPFRLWTPCPEVAFPDCTESHVYADGDIRLDETKFGICEVFTDRRTRAMSWLVPWDRESIECWPGTEIVALSPAELS